MVVDDTAGRFVGATTTADVRVSPIELVKDERSSESEILRGVDDQSSVWTLTVRRAPYAGTQDVVVVDELPGALQLIDCWVGPDDSHDAEAVPCAWSYVHDGGESRTRVEWHLGAVAYPGEIQLHYRAGVGTGTLTADDTFTGDPTRHVGPGDAIENRATLTGTYTGAADGADCAVDGQTVTCTVDGLDVGEQVTVRVRALVARDASGTVVNTATVSSAAEDVAPDGAGTSSASGEVRAVPLATTGVEAWLLALLAALLLAGGVGAVATSRRGGRHAA